jgi:hypothetical protein
MAALRRLALAVLAGAASLGCSEEDIVTIADLVGDWTATKWEYAVTGSSTKVDLIALTGEFEATVDAAGNVDGTITLPGSPAAPFDGTIEIVDNILTLTITQPAADVIDFTYTLSGNTLTLFASDEDVPDAVPSVGGLPASLTIILQRVS